jgi:hypothetical protein
MMEGERATAPDHRPGAFPATLRYTAPASVRQNPRTTRPDAALDATRAGRPSTRES